MPFSASLYLCLYLTKNNSLVRKKIFPQLETILSYLYNKAGKKIKRGRFRHLLHPESMIKHLYKFLPSSSLHK